MSGAATPNGQCGICGCTTANACVDELRGACWWIDTGHKLCSHCAQPDARRTLALSASEWLAEAAAEMVRFHREGDQESFEPFALEPAQHVAEALRNILQIEMASVDRAKTVGADYEMHNQMLGAIDRFLEGCA